MWRRQTTLQKQKRRTQKRTEKKKFCGQNMPEYESKPKGLYFKWKCGSHENYRKFLDEQELPSPARTPEFQLEGDETYYYATTNGWERMNEDWVKRFENAFEKLDNDDWDDDVVDNLLVKRLHRKIYFQLEELGDRWFRVVKLPYSTTYNPIYNPSDIETA